MAQRSRNLRGLLLLGFLTPSPYNAASHALGLIAVLSATVAVNRQLWRNGAQRIVLQKIS
jgi:hypothetical protein